MPLCQFWMSLPSRSDTLGYVSAGGPTRRSPEASRRGHRRQQGFVLTNNEDGYSVWAVVLLDAGLSGRLGSRPPRELDVNDHEQISAYADHLPR